MTAGCAIGKSDTFTFTADLPPGFAYQAIAVYEPAKGETCTVPGGRGTEVGFNRKWRETYQPDSEILFYRTVSGCPLVVTRIKLEINSVYGTARRDVGVDTAGIVIREELEDQYKRTFNERGESIFYGQCQWLFRTMGPKRRIVKLLDCKKTDAAGELDRGRPFSAYTLDQLPGRTVKMKVSLVNEELPYYDGWWLRTPEGWRPCTGRWGTQNEEFCVIPPRFTDFMMPDGRKCTVYPACTE
ncbi:hypothetical protein BK662_31030 [Pseudomonas frederiksbergensis]|uniref:Uncharacterized protein n=2 Tax=Pseudomonas frederiksbergensis TaxID=104087 RepID=A0A423HFA8_9PSED|nr:hypothetical protein BK662_31030 [Pseudomonas frederiksbergensis]